jgi:hypothetical protein
LSGAHGGRAGDGRTRGDQVAKGEGKRVVVQASIGSMRRNERDLQKGNHGSPPPWQRLSLFANYVVPRVVDCDIHDLHSRGFNASRMSIFKTVIQTVHVAFQARQSFILLESHGAVLPCWAPHVWHHALLSPDIHELLLQHPAVSISAVLSGSSTSRPKYGKDSYRDRRHFWGPYSGGRARGRARLYLGRPISHET